MATLLYPSGVRFLAEGVGLQKMTADEYDRVFGRILPAAEKLAKEGSNAISVMGTSLTFYKGAEYEHQLKVNVTKATGLPSTTMSTGIVEGLKALNARRVAVATAYDEDHAHYAGWVEDGKLIAHEGTEIQLGVIQEELIREIGVANWQALAFDKAFAVQMQQALAPLIANGEDIVRPS